MKTKTVKKQSTSVEVSSDTAIRDKAKSLSKDLYEKYFDLSIVLSEIYHTELWKTWGYPSIEEYMEKEITIGYRTGMYHVQMGDAIKKLNITKEMLHGIGWTKFKEAIKLVNDDISKEHMVQVVNDIKDMSVKETEDYIKKQQKKTTSEERVIMSFTFIPDQATAIEKAIQIASELNETDNKSRCLEYICLEFQANYNPELSEKIKALMVDESKLKKAEYKERVDKGKSKGGNKDA